MASAVIDCTFDSWADPGPGESETSTTILVSDDDNGDPMEHGQFRFPLSSVTAGSTVTNVTIQCNKTSESVEAGETVIIGAYNNTGDDDPDLDNAATKASRSASVTLLVEFEGNGTGSTGELDMGATADGQVQGNITSPGFYSVAMRPNSNFDLNEEVRIEAIENAGTDPATLTVTYTAPTTYAGWISSRGGWW